MPVWPFLMALAACFTLWGARLQAWHIPALVLCGYISARCVVLATPEQYVEVLLCASWLFWCALMVYKGGQVPAFFYALSALTYPVLLTFGFRLEYMGFAAVLAEAFAALALLAVGGGLFGLANHPNRDLPGPLVWALDHSHGFARS